MNVVFTILYFFPTVIKFSNRIRKKLRNGAICDQVSGKENQCKINALKLSIQLFVRQFGGDSSQTPADFLRGPKCDSLNYSGT